MRFLAFVKNNLIAVICLILYSVITIVRILNHTPWFDEAHSWTIAEQLNYFDMLKYVISEGHFFVWHTLLYSFAHSHLIPYPYPMQVLNWIFCTSAIILMWWKAPFNSYIKALITFSYPFLACYSVIARCYSIGIFLLFILTVMFYKKLKYPKTYANLLVLCANTSVMALIGATAFGILFLIDITKNKLTKSNYLYIGFILVIGVVLVLYQMFHLNTSQFFVNTRTIHFSLKIFSDMFLNNYFVNVSVIALLSFIFIKYFYKYKNSLFFVLFTHFFLLVFLMYLYDGHFWHYYFSYIFLIISFWLTRDNVISDKNTAILALGMLSLFLVFKKPHDYNMAFDNSKINVLYNAIENDEILKNSQIIQNDFVLYEMIPYSYGKNYIIRNHCTDLKSKDYIFINTFDKYCAIRLTTEQVKRNPDIVKNIVTQANNTYTFVDKKYYNMTKDKYVYSAGNCDILFKKYKCYDRYCFWKIEVIN